MCGPPRRPPVASSRPSGSKTTRSPSDTSSSPGSRAGRRILGWEKSLSLESAEDQEQMLWYRDDYVHYLSPKQKYKITLLFSLYQKKSQVFVVCFLTDNKRFSWWWSKHHLLGLVPGTVITLKPCMFTTRDTTHQFLHCPESVFCPGPVLVSLSSSLVGFRRVTRTETEPIKKKKKLGTTANICYVEICGIRRTVHLTLGMPVGISISYFPGFAH